MNVSPMTLQLQRSVSLEATALRCDTDDERQGLCCGLERAQNVVRMLGCNTTTIPYFIVMEYVGGGSLSAEIKRSGSIPLQESMQWLRQIINGLQHLHQSKLLHRDLKSMNVMIKEAESNGDTGKAQGGLSKAVGRRRRTMKIVDFGETKNLRVPSSLTLEVGTYKWMPPEVMGVGDHLRRKSMEGNVQYHSAADVYSLGMVLYEMVSGKEPFDDMARMQAAFAVTKGKRPSFRGVSCPALLEVMIRTCVHADPMERPTLDIMRALAELVEQGYGVTLAGAGGAASASGCDERTREVGKRGGGELAMLRMSVAAALRPMPPQLQGLTASFLQKMTVGDFMWIRETQEYGEGVKENSTEQPVERNPSGLSSPHHPAVATVVAATTASPAEESPGESPRRTPSRKLKELLLGMLPGSTTRR
jgi:serine/threonine protein kinase